MQRQDAEKMLLQSASGTFLIRFSEGDPGGISVAWVNGEWFSEGNPGGISVAWVSSKSIWDHLEVYQWQC